MMKEVMDPLFFIHQVVGEAASQVAVVNTARQVSRAATHVYRDITTLRCRTITSNLIPNQ